MTLNHVSDLDIVECLQNCPELDGPLFDANVLEELYLSDELWANLDFSGNSTQNLYGKKWEPYHMGGQDNQVFDEEVSGLATPPYSPPTPSDPSPPSCASLPTVDTQSSSCINSQEPIVPSQKLPSSTMAPQKLPKLPSVPAVQESALPSRLPSKQCSLSTEVQKQDLSTLCSQLTLPHFNGSLQVLKSGEIIHLQKIPKTNNNVTQTASKDHTSTQLPSNQVQLKLETPVVGQKRQHPDAALSQTDLSKLSKKQQRMIKNRESACISRQKKRQYVDSLEAKLKEAALKNSALLQENSSLRKQVTVLEKENKSLRLSLSRSSSPFPLSPVKKQTLVVMIVLCFTLSLTLFPRLYPRDSHAPLSTTTALTHVKSRALLSINDEESSFTRHEVLPKSSQPSSEHRNALVPLKSKVSTELQQILERRWKLSLDREEEDTLSKNRVCSCPGGGNGTSKLNLTYVQLMNQEMTSCFKINPPHSSVHYSNNAHENSLTVLNSDYAGEQPSYLVHGPERLYQDFKKYIPRNLDNYYLLSFKDHILLHPPHQNSTHHPLLSVFIPADSDFTSLLQMDCEVTATRIINNV